MNYELKNVKPITAPYTKNVAPPFEPVNEKYGIDINITSGIVGQTYSGFVNNDRTFFELDGTQTIDEQEEAMETFAADFVAEKYPNT